jgi:tetratricopeptide (TPR) repeat protein
MTPKRWFQLSLLLAVVLVVLVFRLVVWGALYELSLAYWGNWLLFQGAHQQALAHYQHAVTEAPKVAGFHLQLASLLHRQGKTAQALQAYEQGLKLDPRQVRGRLNYARLLSRLHRWNQALEQYRQLLLLAPDSLEVMKDLAHLYQQSALQAARQGQPKLEQTYLRQMRLYAEAGVKLAPEDAKAQALLALSLQRLGLEAEAIASYCQAIALEPNVERPLRRYNLGLTLLEGGYEGLGMAQLALAVKTIHQQASRELEDEKAYTLQQQAHELQTYAQALRGSLHQRGLSEAALAAEAMTLPKEVNPECFQPSTLMLD